MEQKLIAELIDARNLRMLERMAPRLKEGKAFVAVGALHLPGDHGLLRLLEKAGYHVSAMY
ncbi:MAG: TraB/GumN family protein [Gammaproteobacteria bacterium]|nr:TraB/GumN family protein [Gammaproteobacteria bacterium]